MPRTSIVALVDLFTHMVNALVCARKYLSLTNGGQGSILCGQDAQLRREYALMRQSAAQSHTDPALDIAVTCRGTTLDLKFSYDPDVIECLRSLPPGTRRWVPEDGYGHVMCARVRCVLLF